MGKENKLFSSLFGEGAKQKKMVKKLKSLKKEYVSLNSKLLSGKISQKELIKYYATQEEIKTMSKKFTLKGGKLSLDKPQEQAVQQQAQQQIQQPMQQPMQQPIEQVVQQQIQRPMLVPEGMPQPQPAELPSQIMADRMELIKREEAIAQLEMVKEQRAREQYAQAQAQAQYQAELQARQQEGLRQQQLASIRAQQGQQPPQPQQLPQRYEAEVFVTDMPVLKIMLEENQLASFQLAIKDSMEHGKLFPYDGALINGSKIVMYRLHILQE